MSPAPDLASLRLKAAAADSASLAAATRAQGAQLAFEKAHGAGADNLAAVRAELESAQEAAKDAAADKKASAAALHEAIATHVEAVVARDDVVAPAEVPVALLPLGLETRFDGDELRIRILPDVLHAEDHEPLLATGEYEVGQRFWTDVWRAGTAEPGATEGERAAWVQLATTLASTRRAAWVADQTEPTGGTRPPAPIADGEQIPDPPVFPDPPAEPAPRARAATTTVLPDAVTAIAYKRVGEGGSAGWEEIARGPAKPVPVPDSVQLGPGDGDPPIPAPDSLRPTLPPGMQWLVDPERAEAEGLLIRLPLPPGTDRIDRLVVIGTRSSLDPETSAQRLTDLLSGHHYTRGMELLDLGTASNNTSAGRSGHSDRDDAAAAFAVERGVPAPVPASDGGLLARALGVAPEVLRGVAGSDRAAQAAAGQMNALVWPATFGYWLDTLVQPGPSDDAIAQIRAHALQAVRARGPLPPLRIGSQPYGVLPVLSFGGWKPASEAAGVVETARYLAAARPWWQDGVGRVPVLRAAADVDQATLEMLSQAPVSQRVRVRSMVGANVSYIASTIYSSLEGPAAEAGRQRWMAKLGFGALGVEGFPYLGQLVAAADPVPLFHLPYAPGADGSADAAGRWQHLVTELRAYRGRSTKDLRAQDPRQATSVLEILAHRAVLLERIRAGLKDTAGSVAGKLVEPQLRIDEPAVSEAQLISTSAAVRIGDVRSAAAAFLDAEIPEPGGAAISVMDHLDRSLVELPDLPWLQHRDYSDTVAAAEAIAQLPPEKASLLLGEALDVASHRLDAWITSYATRRLSDLRAAQPTGVTLGGYGVVEGLERRPRGEAVAPPAGVEGEVFPDPAGNGYVHAPSIAQAATAAVLRSAYMTHGDHPAAMAVDLSSSRVRLALSLLEGVRNGQPLGALLGYRAERALHEGGAHEAVAVLRSLAPPPAAVAPGSPEALQPTAVCDGLALTRMPRSRIDEAFSAADDAGDQAVVHEVLDSLLDAADATADLLLAEGVHQVVSGNPHRAGAALDVLNRGEGAMAEPSVVATPRSGVALTHRVAVLLADEVPAALHWPTDGVRAIAEPRLAAWAGHLLGDPGEASVTFRDAAGASLGEASIAELGLGALDLVHEQLEPRLLRHARRSNLAGAVRVDLESPACATLIAVAEQLRALLTAARPIAETDLSRAQDTATVVEGPPVEGDGGGSVIVHAPDVDGGSRRQRLDAARARLEAALAQLSPGGQALAEADVADALDALACFGIAPGGPLDQEPGATELEAVREAAKARLDAAAAAPEDAAALFGEGFHVLARVTSPSPDALALALAADPLAAAPAEVLAPVGGASGAVPTWIEAQGRVRAGIGRLADLLLSARLRGTGAEAKLAVVQSPSVAFDPSVPAEQRGQWVGLPFPGALAGEPVTSIVAHTLGTPDAQVGLAGLLIDEFAEVIPAEETTTGVSFGFDSPGARPPQSILLAVPAVVGTPWTTASLAEVVGEAVDLAKLRMVDLSTVSWAGRFLPATYVTDGDVGAGLDLPFKEMVSEAAIAAGLKAVDR